MSLQRLSQLLLLLLLSLVHFSHSWSSTFQAAVNRGRTFDDALRSGQCRIDNTVTTEDLQFIGWTTPAAEEIIDRGGENGPPNTLYWKTVWNQPSTLSWVQTYINYDLATLIATTTNMHDSVDVRWSQVAYQQLWQSSENDDEVRALRHVMRDKIDNVRFISLMEEVRTVTGAFLPPGNWWRDAVPWRLFPPHDLFYALMDSPNGRGIAWMLYGSPLLHHLVVWYLEVRNITGGYYDMNVYLTSL